MKRLLLLILFSGLSDAHQTNTSHPVVTTKARNLIAQSDRDTGAYLPLYAYNKIIPAERFDEGRDQLHPIFWGMHAPFDFDGAQRDEENEYRFFRNDLRTVTDGVVAQDAPVTRVLSHFYNAYSGRPLFRFGTTSKEVGVQKFLNAVELMGYSNHIRQDTSFEKLRWFGSPWVEHESPLPPYPDALHDQYLAYWFFGHSLHHLEDMGSIAHTHADAHLTLGWNFLDRHSTDDFEAIFIPSYLWRLGGEGSEAVLGAWYFGCSSNCVPATVSSFDDIWPVPIENPQTPDFGTRGFARKVYNTSIFQANLPHPNLTNDWSAEIVPSGELVDMFTSPNNPKPGITWHKSRRSRYTMMDIGATSRAEYFFSSGIPGLVLNYIPGGNGNSSSVWNVGNLGGPQNYYYIEEHIAPNASRSGQIVTCQLLRPPGGVRERIGEPYHRETNPLRRFSADTAILTNPDTCGQESILGRQAAEVMPMVTKYAAGYAKWWFDIANLPPYLQRVTVLQTHTLVEEKTFVGYDAEWRDVLGRGEVEDDGGGVMWDDDPDVYFVKERKLIINSDVSEQPLSRHFDIEILLTFNEAIKAPVRNGSYDASSGFQLGFQRINPDDPASGDRVMLTQKMADLEIAEHRTTPGGHELDAEDVGRIWKVVIKKEILKEIDLLKGGHVRLIVLAKDRNNHIDRDNRGADLDGRPATPARRKVVYPDDDQLHGMMITNFVTWHDKSSEPGDIFDDEELSAGAFAYDDDRLADGSLVGDRMHILWFGNEKNETGNTPPNAIQNVRTDEVSITLKPAENEVEPEDH